MNDAIQNSRHSNSIYRPDRLIGSGRAISDGVHHPPIVNLIVLPDFQGRGLGKLLLNKSVNRLREDPDKTEIVVSRPNYHSERHAR